MHSPCKRKVVGAIPTVGIPYRSHLEHVSEPIHATIPESVISNHFRGLIPNEMTGGRITSMLYNLDISVTYLKKIRIYILCIWITMMKNILITKKK